MQSGITYLKSCTIRSLMDVLIHILEGGKGGKTLDIDVTIIFCRKPRVIWNN